ncbi:MAG: SGNH/GDSL hydrolase family protein [Pseudomonadota bacterium]|nr:SGNH/GDSL hydrolase family protein [Pseudomonadota bacterium]
MWKRIVFCQLLAVLGCDHDDNRQVEDDGTGGKPDPEQEIKLDLAVVGDSLATGFFSDTTIGFTTTEAAAKQHPIIGKLMKLENLGRLPPASELDTMMKQKYENPFTCAEDKSECGFSYQHQAGVANDKVKNAAVSGSRVDNLLTQLNQIEKAGNAKTYIVPVGGNDYCAAAFKQADYVASMKKVIDKILSANDSAQIIIVAIPNIVELFKTIAPPNTMALEVNSITDTLIIKGLGGKKEIQLRCKHIRDGEKIHQNAPDVPTFCPRISDNLPAAGARAAFFATKKQELDAANQATAALVAGYSNNRIKFAAGVAELAFTAADISADCVHPSRAGQKKLAAAIWQYKF